MALVQYLSKCQKSEATKILCGIAGIPYQEKKPSRRRSKQVHDSNAQLSGPPAARQAFIPSVKLQSLKDEFMALTWKQEMYSRILNTMRISLRQGYMTPEKFFILEQNLVYWMSNLDDEIPYLNYHTKNLYRQERLVHDGNTQ